MLLELRDFIKKQGEVSLQQLQREFTLSESALKPMLLLWQRKGIIASSREDEACAKKCVACKPLSTVFYRYVL